MKFANKVNIKGTSTQSPVDYHYKCESLSEFMKQVNGPAPFVNEGSAQSHKSRVSMYWDLETNFEQATEFLNSGWTEGAEKVAELSAELGVENLVDQSATILEPDFSGSILDVGEYINGNPEHFLEYTESEVPKAVVKICAPLTIAGREDAQSLINRGVAMLALIDAIELTGASTEVWINVYFETRSFNVLTELKIKSSEEPFDVDKLAFIIAHPVFFRRIYFGFVENMNERIVGRVVNGGGYGRPETYKSEDYDILPDYNPDLFRTKEGSLNWIKKHCKKIGIKLSEDVI